MKPNALTDILSYCKLLSYADNVCVCVCVCVCKPHVYTHTHEVFHVQKYKKQQQNNIT